MLLVVSWQQKPAPGYITCNSQIDGIIDRFFCQLKYQMKVDFFQNNS